ncbi:DUF4489 domain-containing protein [Pontibacillus sp. HMF3514]|uniref:DUF4489 domain-containing protein n=1 Tax=Pontibacillus sp. HMF3514 TaxID=2692425 RepID=UPI001320215E|nr:DUF4489 domain-containing protein [Pontibacillus sp. HMF3514]QHE51519.1 DUF4489 domain-containing protein [Pontibacillus sp. HMF3514]
MEPKDCVPFLRCGKTFNPSLPNQLSFNQRPIVLAEVQIDPQSLENPCILIKYSEFIQFTLLGFQPLLSITYRLVRSTQNFLAQRTLDEWVFEFESPEPQEIGNLDTNQPTVLNYCDCLESNVQSPIIYRIEIARIATNNTQNFSILNKNITATAICGEEERA